MVSRSTAGVKDCAISKGTPGEVGQLPLGNVWAPLCKVHPRKFAVAIDRDCPPICLHRKSISFSQTGLWGFVTHFVVPLATPDSSRTSLPYTLSICPRTKGRYTMPPRLDGMLTPSS